MALASNDDSQGIARALRILFVLVSVLLVAAALLISEAASATERSKKAIYDFRTAHPCPATGQRRGACPGYVIDHMKPLCPARKTRASVFHSDAAR
jgi:hypothetical protein